MTEKQIHQGIDRFLGDAYGLLFSIVRGIAAAIGRLWALMPAGWPDYVKAGVMIVGFVVALRLLRGALGWPRRLFGLWWMKQRSPFGRSQWAGLRALRSAGMTKGGGLFLGRWQGWLSAADLYRHGEGHLLTIAGSGAGKSVKRRAILPPDRRPILTP